jgi:hypothetical protein
MYELGFHIPEDGIPQSPWKPQILHELKVDSVDAYQASLLYPDSAAFNTKTNKQTPWPLVRERTIPTDRPPLVDEI